MRYFLLFLLSWSGVLFAQLPPGTLSLSTYRCETDGNGIETFDIAQVKNEILTRYNLDPAVYGVKISYLGNEITTATHTNSTPFNEENYYNVYILATGTNHVFFGPLYFEVVGIPQAYPVPDITVVLNQLDSALQAQALLAAGAQSNVNVSFYQSQTDAQSDVNGMYVGCGLDMPTGPVTLWVRVEVGNSGCYALTSFQCTITTDGMVPLSETIAFADANFKARLLQADFDEDIAYDACGQQMKIDINGDGEIQVDEAAKVRELKVVSAAIASLDGIEHFTKLTFLDFSSNQVAVFDPSPLAELMSLVCASNPLITLDFNANYKFRSLRCQNATALETIILKNGQSYSSSDNSDFSGAASLYYICVDSFEQTKINQVLNASGLSGVVVSTYCTSSPGGPYNAIEGSVTFDLDHDGCDSTDLPYPYMRIKMTGDQNAYLMTDAQGHYDTYVMGDGFALQPIPRFPGLFSVLPATASVTFPSLSGSVQEQDFCVSAAASVTDMKVWLSPVGSPRPGFDFTLRVMVSNGGTHPLDGSLTLSFDDAKLDFVASTPAAVVAPGTLTFAVDDLAFFETRFYMLTFSVNSPTDTPPVVIGDVLAFTASGTLASATDAQPDDNTFTASYTVVGAFDPNNIVCHQGPLLPVADIAKPVHYTVNFENTGNFPAERVVVIVPLHAMDYNADSAQVIATSHPATIVQRGNVLEFHFEAIGLAPSGQGFIVFQLTPRAGLVAGDAIEAKAGIYFDYNAPVATNTASTTYQVLHASGFDTPSFRLHPNPATGWVTLDGPHAIESVQVTNLLGQVVLSESKRQGTFAMLDVSPLSPGHYIVVVKTPVGTSAVKLFKK